MIHDTKKPHRRMGMAAIWMARDSGVSPLALADQDKTQAQEFPRWITAWFLKRTHKLSLDELSRCLDLPHTDVRQMLCRLEHARTTQPRVKEWMNQLVLDHEFRDTTMGEEAV